MLRISSTLLVIQTLTRSCANVRSRSHFGLPDLSRCRERLYSSFYSDCVDTTNMQCPHYSTLYSHVDDHSQSTESGSRGSFQMPSSLWMAANTTSNSNHGGSCVCRRKHSEFRSLIGSYRLVCMKYNKVVEIGTLSNACEGCIIVNAANRKRKLYFGFELIYWLWALQSERQSWTLEMQNKAPSRHSSLDYVANHMKAYVRSEYG
ncbi:hypothetical protein GCK32_018659 [Trichostrongylus colubriformis]|uniref:Uncharacterized protein n=1 Tax=Trichostrongylus colubriformis TaxID=6319 RepID=A0AAN8IV61_TRICO